MAQTVVQVRGTPTCGKTVLSNLLYSCAQKALPDYAVVYVTWQLHGSPTRQRQEWTEFLCSRSGGHIQPEKFWANENVIYIIDEAQLSYEDELFWIECIKMRKDRSVGPYFVLFSSYGSASSIVLEIKGSAPVDLRTEQCVPLTPQPDWPHDITLCFTAEELRDMCQRIVGQRGFTVDADVLEHLFILTNGHPGLAQGLFLSLLDREDIRPVILAGGQVTLNHASKLFDDDMALFACVEARVCRSLPTRSVLRDKRNEDLANTLKRAVQQHGVEAFRLEDDPGLQRAYKQGYLHAVYNADDGLTLYAFPSMLHHRAVERLLFPDDDDGIQFASLKDLCFEALKHFSQTALTSHRRKINHAPGATRPEAQYVYELYRCLYHITGGKSIVHSEYSYAVAGRIDLFLRNRRWGIEALKDGDRMSEHIHRCGPRGVYGSWGVVSEYILLNFCTAPPKTKRDIPELFHVIFNATHDKYQVLDSTHRVIVEGILTHT
ncbi:hypothetical protein BDD12DRAFT_835165 [Trichophaea hybrida]|nr:hypothetical protein BDD12DRAFT_835165 [Trichophaea hybrida]